MEYNKYTDSFISFLFQPHEVKTNAIYLNSIFWFKKGSVIAEIENSNYFKFEISIWDQISRELGLDYYQVQLNVNVWLEKNYDLGKLTPLPEIFYHRTYDPVFFR